MEPRVSKREKKLHLSYDLPHRIRCAAIYPIHAPNGSSVILYGHDNGLRLLWRGGRRFKRESPQKNGPAKGTSEDIILIDADDEPDAPDTQEDTVEYESEDDEMDPDCAFPSIVQTLDIDLAAPVLHIAAPELSSLPLKSPLLEQEMVIVAVHPDGELSLLRIPLAPPAPNNEKSFAESVSSRAWQLQTHAGHARDVAVKISEELDNGIVVAAVSDSLTIWQIPVAGGALQSEQARQIHVGLPHLTIKVCFHPSPHLFHLLLVDISGAIRTYEPPVGFQPTSDDPGKWSMAYLAPFQPQKQGTPSIVGKKRILDAKWILKGRCVLAIFDDGQWGIWDVLGSTQQARDLSDFALSGFLGSAIASETAEPATQKRTHGRLAPMTPNTRKSKADNLFTAPAKLSNLASRGGISVARVRSTGGSIDESVVLWLDSEIYSIPNLQSFWQRSTSGSGGLGSLYAPGIAHIQGLNLFHENITSIAQFHSNSTSSSLGKFNPQRDFLVSAEHRFIIVQSNKLQPTVTEKFQQASNTSTTMEQRLLKAGDLDLGGVDRILDSIGGGNDRARKVGFAH